MWGSLSLCLSLSLSHTRTQSPVLSHAWFSTSLLCFAFRRTVSGFLCRSHLPLCHKGVAMLMSFCSFHTAQSKTPSSYSQVTSLFVCRLFLRLCLQFRCFILAFLRSVPWQITMFRCSGFALLLPVFCKVPSLFSHNIAIPLLCFCIFSR